MKWHAVLVAVLCLGLPVCRAGLLQYAALRTCTTHVTHTPIIQGYGIALPPVLNFGTPHLQQKMRDVVEGRKIICLAITEPHAGSDVAGIRTTATLTADGTHYVVSGEKKW